MSNLPDKFYSKTDLEIMSAVEKAAEIADTMANDLQTALNMIRGYQRNLDTLMSNDPQIVAANALLRKYGMPSGHSKPQPYRIIVDDVDITEHPDSIEGSTSEAIELENPERKEIPERGIGWVDE